MLRIWGRKNSLNVQKVMWAVAELGLEHERIDAGGAFGRLDTPEYGRLNPNRRVPTVVDGDLVVWESNVCVRYLAARYGDGGLWPSDPAARAGADMWMDWMATTVMPDLGVPFWQLVRTPPEERDMPAVAAAVARLGPIWSLLEAHLADRRFVAADRLTMGDIPVGVAYWRYRSLPIERPSLPNLERWENELQASAAYRAHVMLPLT
ncbi:MAG TPA: glutathione S-transferase [Geminicoccaceae bacterium]|nr:glutathione S-transferase [Geminicoccus sp.]HMU49940.1 glutathione S-transferase [Geminicoccaceae bacterium]